MKRIFLLFIVLMVSIALFFPSCGPKKPDQSKQQAEAIRELGEAYMAEGNYTMALRELMRAEQLYPNDPYLQNSLGLAYMARGRNESAVSHFQKALALNPSYSPARNNLGSAYISLEEWDKAIECFEYVKDDLLYATPFFPLSNLGYVYYRKGDFTRAGKYYQEALDMERRFPRAHHGLGMVAMATGNVDEAIRRFETAIELAPEAAVIYMDLARAYEQKHEYSKALSNYEKVASMAKDSKLGDEAELAIKNLRGRW
jgi:type IV pilus assembly protein PilF